MTDTVCPTCGNWFGNHDPECVVATTIHAIWAVSFGPRQPTSPVEWNRAIETILADNAHRVAAALGGGADLRGETARAERAETRLAAARNVIRRCEDGWYWAEKFGTTGLYWFNGHDDPEPVTPAEVAEIHAATNQPTEDAP